MKRLIVLGRSFLGGSASWLFVAQQPCGPGAALDPQQLTGSSRRTRRRTSG